MCGTSPRHSPLSSTWPSPNALDCTDHTPLDRCVLCSRCVLVRHQASERIEVPLIHRIRRNRASRLAFALGRFQQHREVAKPPIVDDPSKWLESEESLANVFVTIDAAAERTLRIVQMKRLQPVEPDETAEL